VADSPQVACLVTGVAGGVGMALSEAFHEAGYFVIGTDSRDYAGSCVDRFLRADLLEIVQSEPCADRFFSTVEDCLGERMLAALVNNAAVQIVSPASELTVADWNATLGVNVVAPFLLSKRLLRRLSGGCIINISSIHARLTKRNFAAYATSKAALTGLTRALAVDVGDRVRVNAIEPAALDTAMLREGFLGHEARFSDLAAHHPTGRIGSPAEVGKLAVLIAGSAMPFLNGAVIGLDGGISGRLHDPA
jgi:NAD(P)-dependent dehydrogenase (short-subunit alcohol dehydrogenase family)